MRRIHLDTDLGGDTDDACALAMLLGHPQVQVTGITTNLDIGGQRAGCANRVLQLAGRRDIPLAAGAEASLTTGRRFPSTWDDDRYWPDPVVPLPSPPGAALDLLADSIDQDATIVAIGAYTNLALLSTARPGMLAGVDVVAMGGWLAPPRTGLPQWGPEMDWNVQCDTTAAEVLFGSAADLTIAPLGTSMSAQLRASQLSTLEAAGPLGQLLALQARAHGEEFDMPAMGRAHAGLAHDLLNFQWDPVACAVAVGSDAASVEDRRISWHLEDDLLRLRETGHGRSMRVLDTLDLHEFDALWLESVGRTRTG